MTKMFKVLFVVVFASIMLCITKPYEEPFAREAVAEKLLFVVADFTNCIRFVKASVVML